MNILLWTIYGIGVVLTPIVCGMLCGKERWSIEDDCIPMFFLSFLWPVLLALIVGFAIVATICVVCGTVWWFLLMLGRLLALKVNTKKDCRKPT